MCFNHPGKGPSKGCSHCINLKTGVRNLHLEPSEREEIREAWDIYKRHTLSNSIINGMVIRDDELTLVMQENGEIPITENYGYGLYYHDCRYLSGFFM